MSSAFIYAILSTSLVSLMSLIGILTMSIRRKLVESMVFLLISLSAGALLGDVFFHLLPEVVDSAAGVFSVRAAFMILLGILSFFVLEKFVIWHHHHVIETPEDHENHQHTHTHSIGIMNLVGDAFHNLLDGMIIGASFLISPVVGVSTTIAVLLHEIPQEIGDFGVLIHSGFSVRKALLYNFLTGLVAVFGAIFAFVFAEGSESLLLYLVPLTVGAFIYIAGSDLIPELKKDRSSWRSFAQLLVLVLGMGMMYLLLYLE